MKSGVQLQITDGDGKITAAGSGARRLQKLPRVPVRPGLPVALNVAVNRTSAKGRFAAFFQAASDVDPIQVRQAGTHTMALLRGLSWLRARSPGGTVYELRATKATRLTVGLNARKVDAAGLDRYLMQAPYARSIGIWDKPPATLRAMQATSMQVFAVGTPQQAPRLR